MHLFTTKTLIIVISIGLISFYLIRIEKKHDPSVFKDLTFVKSSNDLPHKTVIITKEDTKKIANNSESSIEQIIAQLNSKDSVQLLQALSHIWTNIDLYNQNKVIMKRVHFLSRYPYDKRISGLASLVSGKLINKEKLTNTFAMTHDEWQKQEYEELVMQEDESESDNENIEIITSDDSIRHSVDKNERAQYIDQLVSNKDESSVNELTAMINDEDIEISIAAVDALLDALKQGAGEAEEIEIVLKENLSYLDDLQLEEFETLSKFKQ